MSNWKKTLISPKTSLKDSIRVLHEGGLRIALVVDEKNKLLGTLTDGDVRRALIQHYSMKSPIEGVMKTKPVTAKKIDTGKSVLEVMKNQGLLHMPIVDDENILIGLEMLQDLVKKTTYNNPIFLMAGGFGTRLRPLTNKIPKPLLNVGEKPILETILLQFIKSGFHNFFISTHYKAEMIRNHFGDGSRWGVSIQYMHEEKPLGTAGSLGLLPKDMVDLPIIMMNGDLLTHVDFEALLDFHNNNTGIATMCVREYDFQVPYGVVKSIDHKIASIIEKPIHSFFVNAGIYVLNKDIIRTIDGTSYLDMPHLLGENIENGEVINMFPIHEYWLDIGQKDQYILANQEIKYFFK
jgi:dTDP-glucose pyrophosphorylase/predicted transcriptional regulator